MQIHIPDPRFTHTVASRANFRLAVKLALGFVALLWFIHAVNWGIAPGLEEFGVRPRAWDGLPGILLAPLLHANFEHLLANSVPLVVLGTAMIYLYPHALPKVLPVIWLGTGTLVWLLGGAGIHVGASGLVYGLAGFVFVSGLLRRDRRAIAAALVVAFLYGTLVWGVMPIERKVSWETHLAAAVLGIVMAIALRHVDVPPRLRYTWEDEPEPATDDGFDWNEVEGNGATVRGVAGSGAAGSGAAGSGAAGSGAAGSGAAGSGAAGRGFDENDVEWNREPPVGPPPTLH